MKKEYFGWIMAIVVVAVVVATGAAGLESRVGRFQIIKVERDIIGKNGDSFVAKQAILIDSATGQSWYLSAAMQDNNQWLSFEGGPK
jgi:hypothetical protein